MSHHYVENTGLAGRILIDLAGMHDYHIGDAPDLRAQRAAQQRGYDMGGLRGRHDAAREVPDPYYGGAEGFERVLDMVEDAAQGLLQHIQKRHSNTPSNG